LNKIHVTTTGGVVRNIMVLNYKLRRQNIGNKGIQLFVSKGNAKLVFDQVFRTQKGMVVGVEMVPRTNATHAMAALALERRKTININILHQVLGHPSEETTRKTASFYGWKVNGTFNPCENCGIAKSRQKNVNKVSKARSKNPGEIFISQNSIQQKSNGGSKFWLLVFDDCTDFCLSAFLKKKSDQVEWLETLIKDLKVTRGVTIKRMRCDNAG
jgi:hypothetical protein